MFDESDAHWLDEDAHGHGSQAEDWGDEQGSDETERILLSMWDDHGGKPSTLSKVDAARVRNKVCARTSREADRVYMELLLAELCSLAETFEMYAAHIAQLQLLGASAAECTHGLGRCLAHTASLARVQTGEARVAMPPLPGTTKAERKERNRIHAQTSRWKKSCFVRELIAERDASLSTVADLLQYTRTLEGSCRLLNDFSEHAAVVLTQTEARRRLLQRASTHAQQCELLKSPLEYRETHRGNFR
jgi:hypothetical protein